MPTASSTIATRRKPVSHGYGSTLNQFESIKPIEVKCFLENQTLTIETEQKQPDVTAMMTTIIPPPPTVKRPSSVPLKTRTLTAVTDMVISKPIRHIAVLPSAKEQAKKRLLTDPTNLSETFNLYDGPTTTPDLGRSMNDTMTITHEQQQLEIEYGMPPIIEVRINDHQECDTTTVSSVCELLDQAKLNQQQKPHSLIGRFPSAPPERTTKPNPPVHIATVHYGEEPTPETTSKQVLIQQFYAQLEKMKATFAVAEPVHQMTTNTLTFDDGQVRQICASNQLKEKASVIRPTHCTAQEHAHPKPPVSKQPRTRNTSSTRIQSAPITMATRQTTIVTTNTTAMSKCRTHRPEKKVNPPKKSSSVLKTNQRSESAPLIAPVQVELRSAEVTLLPQDEEECRQIYEKLLSLQPNGACADMNTLRRALYPPVGTTAFSSSSLTPTFKSSRPRTEEMPQSWTQIDGQYVSPYVPQPISQPASKPLVTNGQTNMDRIADQMKKHAAINYSYYTRTK